MDWIKIEASEQSHNTFVKALYADTKNQTLSAPAKELVLKEVDENQLQHRVWTENTLIRIEKHQCAVLLLGDKILGSRGTPGDYKLCSQEDISEAKVYFVRTDVVSGKIFESNTVAVYPARIPELNVEQEIRLRSALFFNYRVKNPKMFVKHLILQKQKRMTRQTLEPELYGVFSACLPDVLGQLAQEGIAYNEICGQTERLTELMKERLALVWQSSRGIELKTFRFVKADPYKVDEKAFFEKCQQAQATEEPPTEEFSEEFGKLMKELGQLAGDAINAFQGEMTSFFGELAEALDKELNTEGEAEDEDYDSLLDSILSGSGTDVMGVWECPELKQTVTFALLDAAIATDGKEVWRGDWEQTKNEAGTTLIVCPTADSLGCYAYFERHTDPDNPDEEYLAGVLKDTGTEKQYIRFTKIAK